MEGQDRIPPHRPGLTLRLYVGEPLWIGPDISVTLCDSDGSAPQVVITAPDHCVILRHKLRLKLEAQGVKDPFDAKPTTRR